MDDLEKRIMNYIFNYTDIKNLKKDRTLLRAFVMDFKNLVDKCSLIQKIIKCENCEVSYQKKLIKKERLSNHHCILCDSIFTGKNRTNIPKFFEIIKKVDEPKKINIDDIENYINMDNFIIDFLNFIDIKYENFYDFLKKSDLTKGKFKILLKKCCLTRNLFYTIKCRDTKKHLCHDILKTKCCDKCFICNIIFRCLYTSTDIKEFFNIFLSNMYNSDIKTSNNTINNHVSQTENYFIYDLKHIKSNFRKDNITRSSFSILASNKNSRVLNQWEQLFLNKNIFVNLKEKGVFFKLIGVVRYFMLPLIYYNNNETKYLNYNELCDLNKKKWNDYCNKHVDSFFTLKKLYESLVQLSESDSEYYDTNYNNILRSNISLKKFPKINEDSVIEKFCIVHLKIIDDCKKLLNILNDLNEIKFVKLKMYLTTFRMSILNDIFGNIIMSWTHVYNHKDIAFKSVNYAFDYTDEYNIEPLIEIDRLINDSLNINTVSIDNDIEEGEYSPEAVQKEINLLKAELM